MISKIDNFFKVSERGSTLGREFRGGLTTFFAMAYIVVLNPILLSGADSTGHTLDGAQVAALTALLAAALTILMGFVANFPLAISSGLGITSMVAVSVRTLQGATWADIMGLVVIEGVIILILVLTGFRKAVFNAVPEQLKTAIGIGIGLFLALIGLWDAGFLSAGSGTPLQIEDGGSVSTVPVAIFVLTLFLMFVLYVRKAKSSVLLSIVIVTVIAFIVEGVLHLGSGAKGGGWASNVPAYDGVLFEAPDFSLFGHFNLLGSFQSLGIITAVMLIFSLMLSSFFDAIGTMFAVAKEGDLLDHDGNPLSTQKILVVDSVGIIAGGACGISANTMFVESATGVAEGARTGLASVFTGLFFLLSCFLAPLVHYVPAEVTTPSLVFVGFLMLSQVKSIKFDDLTTAIPAFMIIIITPFAYSITAGIGAGFITYVILKLATGKVKEIHPLMWGAALLFVIFFIQAPLTALFN